MIEWKITLSYDGNDTILSDNEQPNGFSSLESTIERSFKSHGVVYNYTEGDLKLSFPGRGRTIFKNAMESEGLRAEVTLTIESRVDQYSSYVLDYTGTAIMENLNIDRDYANVDFEEISVQTLIKDRQEVPVKSDRDTDLDGNSITPSSTVQVYDTGKSILKESSVVYTNGELNGNALTFTFGSFVNTHTFKTAKTELEYQSDPVYETGQSSTGLTLPDNYFGSYIGGQFNLFDINGIDYSAEITVTGDLSVTNENGLQTGVLTLRMYIFDVSTDEDNNLVYSLDETRDILDIDIGSYNSGADIQNAAPINGLTGSTTYSYTGEDKVFRLAWVDNYLSSDPFILWATPVPNISDPSVTGETANFTVTVSVDTEEDPSNIESQYVIESIRHNIEAITGDNIAYSEYFGRTDYGYNNDGDAYNYLESNGFKIRSFDKPIVWNLKERLESLQNIFGLGWNVERDGPSGEYRFRIEPYEYFYNTDLLVEFEDVIEYSEEYFREEFFFNQVILGYDEYSEDEDEPGTIDDQNTQTSYLLPIKRLQGEKAFISKYIASDYLIEITRRKQFSSKPTTSDKYDDKVFIMDAVYNYDNDRLEPGSDIASVTSGFENPVLFNAYISPAFNLYNHYLVVNSILYKIPTPLTGGDAIYRNTQYFYNGDAKIRYSVPGGNIGNTSTYISDFFTPELQSNITVNGLGDKITSGRRIFDPIKISFQVGLTSEDFFKLKEGYRNGLYDSNYGVIRVTNPDGETIEGWLLKCSFNIVDKIGKFEIIKKSDLY